MVKVAWKDGKMLFKNGKPVVISDNQHVDDCGCCGCRPGQCCDGVYRCFGNQEFDRAKKVQDFIIEIFDVGDISSQTTSVRIDSRDPFGYVGDSYVSVFMLNGLSALNGTYNGVLAPIKCHPGSYSTNENSIYPNLTACAEDKGSKYFPYDMYNYDCSNLPEEWCSNRRYCSWGIQIPEVPITGSWYLADESLRLSGTLPVRDFWVNYTIKGKASFYAAHSTSGDGGFAGRQYNTLIINAIAEPVSWGGYYREWKDGSYQLEKKEFVPITYYIEDTFSRRLEYSTYRECSFFVERTGWLPEMYFWTPDADSSKYNPDMIFQRGTGYGDHIGGLQVPFSSVPAEYCNSPKIFEEGEPIYHNGYSYSNEKEEGGLYCSISTNFTGIYGGSSGRIILEE